MNHSRTNAYSKQSNRTASYDNNSQNLDKRAQIERRKKQYTPEKISISHRMSDDYNVRK